MSLSIGAVGGIEPPKRPSQHSPKDTSISKVLIY